MRFNLIDLLLPDTCSLCLSTVSTPQRHLCCDACWRSLPRIVRACRHCACEVAEGDICGSCLTRPLSMGIAAVPFVYRDETLRLVSALKFQNNFRSARTLAYGIVQQVQAIYDQDQYPDAVVPTPLSWQRHVVRGYNQTERLAKEVGKALNIPVVSHLSRKHGPTQHGNTKTARKSLPISTFKFRRSPPKHIALIDDVITTGTTMSVMAKVCLRAGVHRVDLWAACRTPEAFSEV